MKPIPIQTCVSLHLGASVAAARENVLLPWFEAARGASWRQREPTLVVVPWRNYAYGIKALLLERGMSFLGVRFVSPAELRELLSAKSGVRLPLREHLRLLLSIAAEECLEIPADPVLREKRMLEADFLAAQSVARAPDHLLRVTDQLGAAGWNFAEAGPPALREVEARFQQHVLACGFELVHSADRKMLEQFAGKAPLFHNLLIAGFNGAHWPLWPLLRAGIAAAKEATVILDDPRDEARDLDETWVGTWEEKFGEAQPINDVEEAVRATLADRVRLPETTLSREDPATNVYFLIGRETAQQAEAIAALTAIFLNDTKADRIGILFSRRGALPRLVATLLEKSKIPHHDSLAHLMPGALDDPAWRAWLELQERPRLWVLLQFLRNTTSARDFPIAKVEDILNRAYCEVLIDDIDLLREYCNRHAESESSLRVAQMIGAIQFLPAQASFPDFLSATQKIFQQLGWAERWSEVERLSLNWNSSLTAIFSRRTFLRWLAEITASSSLHREEHGDNPYSRVHLLTYEEAEGQQWSHLIFAGLNEGGWPEPGEDSGFISEEEIEVFNRHVKILNRRAVKQGRHGEGQWTTEEGKTLYLGATERRQIALRQFLNLIQSPARKIAVTANLLHESTPERTWNPSEFFSRLYFAARGKPLSQAVMHELEAKTREWISDPALFSESETADSSDVAQTRVAYDARRQPGTSTEYNFALAKPPPHAISLRVTDWERALKSPGLVWMKAFLGVEPSDEDSDAWSRSTGQWVHHWLAQSAGAAEVNQFVELPEESAIRTRLFENARQFRDEIQRLCEVCHRLLPHWWSSGWSNALYVADCLAENLSGLNDWSQLATEWRLSSPQIISLGDNKELRVRGRIDLILARGEQSNLPFGYSDLWVIDYKTGRQRSFNLRESWRDETPQEKFRKKLASGEAVQLGLYALAVRALGASSVRLTLLTRSTELEPQFSLKDVLAQPDFWSELHRMQETGIFGMLGPVRSAYSSTSAYPLATLAVDPEFLKEKWVATHPAFVTPENGSAEP